MAHPGVEQRNRLLKGLNLVLVSVFDTNENEPEKDVVRVRQLDGKEAVLRVGERRQPDIFPNGYSGTFIVVPRILHSSAEPLFELVELLNGPLLDDHSQNSTPLPETSRLNRIIDAFWEIQTAFTTEPLPDAPSPLEKHIAPALTLLPGNLVTNVQKALEQHRHFFNDVHPAKWKFAEDNLIDLPDGRLGLIDLARVGNRFWGYDLGWIYWSRWFRLPPEYWQDPAAYVPILENFFSQVYTRKPSTYQLETSDYRQRMLLGLLTRLIGGLYDVAETVSHMPKWIDTEKKKEDFISFLTFLINWTLRELDTQ